MGDVLLREPADSMLYAINLCSKWFEQRSPSKLDIWYLYGKLQFERAPQGVMLVSADTGLVGLD